MILQSDSHLRLLPNNTCFASLKSRNQLLQNTLQKGSLILHLQMRSSSQACLMTMHTASTANGMLKEQSC